jgi:hypothetical protein
MAYRRKMNKKHNRKNFKSGLHTRKRNVSGNPMRGGIRL